MTYSSNAIPEEFELAPPKSVVILSLLDGKTVYTHCPPGTTLEQAKAVYLPRGGVGWGGRLETCALGT